MSARRRPFCPRHGRPHRGAGRVGAWRSRPRPGRRGAARPPGVPLPAEIPRRGAPTRRIWWNGAHSSRGHTRRRHPVAPPHGRLLELYDAPHGLLGGMGRYQKSQQMCKWPHAGAPSPMRPGLPAQPVPRHGQASWHRSPMRPRRPACPAAPLPRQSRTALKVQSCAAGGASHEAFTNPYSVPLP